MDSGNAKVAERFYGIGIGPDNFSNNGWFHSPYFSEDSLTAG